MKEEVASPKTTKRARESPAQEPDEPEKVTPKRPKTLVREQQQNTVCVFSYQIPLEQHLAFCEEFQSVKSFFLVAHST